MTSLTVDDLRFEVRPSVTRTTVQITVDRGGEQVITAPEGCNAAVMEEFVREKRFWLYTDRGAATCTAGRACAEPVMLTSIEDVVEASDLHRAEED